jgi:hypothetical protein
MRVTLEPDNRARLGDLRVSFVADARDRLRDAAAALNVAARSHPDELNLDEVHGRWAEVGDALEALETTIVDGRGELTQ